MRRELPSFAALIVLASCQSKIPVGVNVDSKLAALVPSSSTVLAGADVEAIKSTAFYERHQDQIKIPDDLRRNLSSILLTWQNNNPLVLMRGHFSSGDISVNGRTSKEPKGLSDTIRTRLRQLPKTDQAWIVSTQGLPIDRFPMSSDARSALANIVDYINGFQAGVSLDTGAHIHADLSCISAEDARQVHDAIRGGIGLARLTTKDNQMDLLKLYDAIQVTYENSNVHVRADLPANLADQLLQTWQQSPLAKRK